MTNILSTFYQLDIQPEKSLVKLIWKKESKQMLSDDDFIQIQEIYLKAVVENSARNTLVDLRHLDFVVVPKLQEEISTKNFPIAIQAGLRRVAVLNSPDVFTQISSQQLMDEDNAHIFQTMFFDNETDALHWLLKYEQK